MSGERIETAGELDALPVGSVVIDVGPDRVESDAPAVACKAARGDWQVMGGDSDRRWWSHEIADGSSRSVLLVVHRPDRDLIAEAEARGARRALLDFAAHFEKHGGAWGRMSVVEYIRGEYLNAVAGGSDD